MQLPCRIASGYVESFVIDVESIVITQTIRTQLFPRESRSDHRFGATGDTLSTQKTRSLDATLPARLHRTNLTACVGARPRRHSNSWTSNRRSRVACHRAGSGPTLHQLPSSTEPQPLVQPLDRALPAKIARQHICALGPSHRWSRRYY